MEVRSWKALSNDKISEVIELTAWEGSIAGD